MHRVTRGLRRTLIVALEDAGPAETLAARRGAYWAATEARFKALAQSEPLAQEPKLHLLHGAFLEPLGRHEEALAAYCASYRATADPAAVAALVERFDIELYSDFSAK